MPKISPQTPQPEWFALSDPANNRDGTGLQFSCTMCGNCCSGPEGYVLMSDAELAALAKRFKLSIPDFIAQYTKQTAEGRSLKEKKSIGGLDCIFLDREKIPGKAVCGVYEDRPMQCRTWPFWPSVIKTRAAWDRATRVCPGMDKGQKHPLVQIRIARDAVEI